MILPFAPRQPDPQLVQRRRPRRLPVFVVAVYAPFYIRQAVQLIDSILAVSALILQSIYAVVFQNLSCLVRNIVGNDSRHDLIKAYCTHGLCFKVFRGKRSRPLIKLLDLLRRGLAHFQIAFSGEQTADCGNRFQALCRLNQQRPRNLTVAEMCSRPGYLVDKISQFFVNGGDPCIVFLPVYGSETPAVRFDFCNASIARCRRCLQSRCRCSPKALSSLALLTAHRLYDVFQRISIVHLSKTSAIAGSGIRIFPVVKPRFPVKGFDLRSDPCSRFFVAYGISQVVLCCVVVVFTLCRAAVLIHGPGILRELLQRKYADVVLHHAVKVFLPPGFCLLFRPPVPLCPLLQYGLVPFRVVISDDCTDRFKLCSQSFAYVLAFPQVRIDLREPLRANLINEPLQSFVAIFAPFLCFLHRFQGLAAVRQISRLYRVGSGQLFRQFIDVQSCAVIDSGLPENTSVAKNPVGNTLG